MQLSYLLLFSIVLFINYFLLKIFGKKYALDKPLFHQYFYYLNDLSFISIHDNLNADNYTYIGNYNYFTIISLNNNSFG